MTTSFWATNLSSEQRCMHATSLSSSLLSCFRFGARRPVLSSHLQCSEVPRRTPLAAVAAGSVGLAAPAGAARRPLHGASIGRRGSSKGKSG